ncbi:hypothetical protein [Ferrovibrio terrae]|uniref:hypothetical protein n=1 Tax=Ferrovibrio terrae TaxID=2594003 RepID=UPI0031379C78
MIPQRPIRVGETVRITDAIYGEVKEVVADYFGTIDRLIIEVSDTCFINLFIEDLPTQRLDS